MKWFYEIRGTANRLIERSEPIYNAEKEAIDAGGARAKLLVSAKGGPGSTEVLSVMAGRK
jgi:hypothetical protein